MTPSTGDVTRIGQGTAIGLIWVHVNGKFFLRGTSPLHMVVGGMPVLWRESLLTGKNPFVSARDDTLSEYWIFGLDLTRGSLGSKMSTEAWGAEAAVETIVLAEACDSTFSPSLSESVSVKSRGGLMEGALSRYPKGSAAKSVP